MIIYCLQTIYFLIIYLNLTKLTSFNWNMIYFFITETKSVFFLSLKFTIKTINIDTIHLKITENLIDFYCYSGHFKIF